MTTLPANFKIEPATAADVPLILALIRELADYEKLAHQVTATEDLLGRELFGSTPRAEVLIARCGEEAAGYALFFHSFSTFLGRAGLYLEDLYIRPHLRGQGLGRALLGHVAKIATERNCGRLEWSVLNWNEPAIRFYESLGAVAMEEWTVYRVTGTALGELAGL